MNWWAALLLAAGITRLWADVDATSLLVRVRSRVLDSARTYRDRFADRTSSARPSLLSKKQPRSCWTLPGPLFSDSSDSGAALGLKSQMPGLSLISSDRAKLDVMVSESSELFSWPDESRFNTNSPRVDFLAMGTSQILCSLCSVPTTSLSKAKRGQEGTLRCSEA